MDGVIDKIEWYEEILSEDSSSPLFSELSELLYEDGYFSKVVEVCKKGLVAHPYNFKGRLFYGLALFRVGMKKEAFQVLDDLWKELQVLKEFFNVFAILIEERGENKEAERLKRLAEEFEYKKFEIKEESKETAVLPEEVSSSPRDIIREKIYKWLSSVEEAIQKSTTSLTTSKIRLFDEEDKEFLKESLLKRMRQKRKVH